MIRMGGLRAVLGSFVLNITFMVGIVKNFSVLQDRKLHVSGLMSVSLRTADAFPVVASLPPKTGEKGEKQPPEMRLLFAG